MNTEEAAPERRVLKRYSAEDRERLIQEYQASGLGRREFCEQHGVNVTTFHGWFKKRRKKTAKFAEVKLAVANAEPIELTLTNGVRVGIRHQGTQEELVALIRGVAGC